LERGAAGEGGIARDADDIFIAAAQVASDGETERGGEGGAGVARAVAVVLAFGAEGEAVEAGVLPDGVDAVPAASEHLVHVGLMGDVPDELVRRRVKDPVEGDA